MPFEVIPALDVSEGRLVRVRAFGPGPVDAFGGDPLAAAHAFVAAGARWLHVVDVDLAFEGEPRNLDVVRALSGSGAWIQASGGIAELRVATEAFAAGAARVVLGSASLADRALVEDAASRFGPRIAIGVEIEDERIVARGRREVVLDLTETLSWLRELDAPRLVATSVTRVGEASGPDLDGLRRVVDTGLPTIAAGGIATIDDVLALFELGAEGAIVGRAALDGTLDLAEALGICSTAHA